jgi:chaperone modulatory protein CbpM
VIGSDELVRRFAGLDAAELARWIEQRWVLPEHPAENGPDGEPLQFREVDVARVELILHVRREFAVDDDAMALLLGLLDQVYSLRRQMRRLCDAIERQPADIRDAIRHALAPVGPGER